MAKASFYEKMINAVEKIPTVTHQEKIDKADTITAISQLTGSRGYNVKWNGKKWKVIPKT